MLSARLGVKNLDRELKFYTALGFEAEKSGHGARVSFRDVAFTLEPYDELRVSDGPLLDWDRTPAQLGVGTQLYIFLDDLDTLAQSIPVGIPRQWPVQDKPWGLRELTLRTPSGYLLTFAERR